MNSKPTMLSVALAAVIGLSAPAHAGLLGGAAGGDLGGTMSGGLNHWGTLNGAGSLVGNGSFDATRPDVGKKAVPTVPVKNAADGAAASTASATQKGSALAEAAKSKAGDVGIQATDSAQGAKALATNTAEQNALQGPAGDASNTFNATSTAAMSLTPLGAKSTSGANDVAEVTSAPAATPAHSDSHPAAASPSKSRESENSPRGARTSPQAEKPQPQTPAFSGAAAGTGEQSINAGGRRVDGSAQGSASAQQAGRESSAAAAGDASASTSNTH